MDRCGVVVCHRGSIVLFVAVICWRLDMLALFFFPCYFVIIKKKLANSGDCRELLHTRTLSMEVLINAQYLACNTCDSDSIEITVCLFHL